MARLKPNCPCIRSVMLLALLAMLGMAFAAPPAVANTGPDNKVNTNNAYADDIPWNEFTDSPGNLAWVGPAYMVMNVGYWLVDAGLIGPAEDSPGECAETGNLERIAADGNHPFTDPQ